MSDWELILSHVPLALLVVFRLGGLMVFGPVFGSSVVPTKVKVFLALLIGLAIYPALSSRQPMLIPDLNLWSLAPVMAMELLIGMVIGFIASIPLVAVQTGGLVMGQQMGLGFARFYNPAIEDEADVLGQMLFFMALAGFLLIGGLEAMVLAVLHSFDCVPLGGFRPDTDLLALIVGLLLSAFEFALRIAAPLLALIFLETLAMGFLSKTVPQLNILSLGFPVRILAGLLIVSLGLVVINDVMMEAIDEMLTSLFNWIDLN